MLETRHIRWIFLGVAIAVVFTLDLQAQTSPPVEQGSADQQVIDEIMNIRQRLGGGLTKHLNGISAGVNTNTLFGEALNQEVQSKAKPGPIHGVPTKGFRNFKRANFEEAVDVPIEIPQGMLVIALKVADCPADSLRPGDTVDLIQANGSAHCRTILRNTQIFFINKADKNQADVPDGNQVVGLLINREDRERVVEAQKSGLVKLVVPERTIAAGLEKSPEIGYSRDQVQHIRSAARILDEVASQLEEGELFGEADQVRDMAQSLRVKARREKGRKRAGSID